MGESLVWEVGEADGELVCFWFSVWRKHVRRWERLRRWLLVGWWWLVVTVVVVSAAILHGVAVRLALGVGGVFGGLVGS